MVGSGRGGVGVGVEVVVEVGDGVEVRLGWGGVSGWVGWGDMVPHKEGDRVQRFWTRCGVGRTAGEDDAEVLGFPASDAQSPRSNTL